MVSGSTLVGAIGHGHGGRAYMHPHKFPVEVERVAQHFTTLKGCIRKIALRPRGAKHQQGEDEGGQFFHKFAVLWR